MPIYHVTHAHKIDAQALNLHKTDVPINHFIPDVCTNIFHANPCVTVLMSAFLELASSARVHVRASTGAWIFALVRGLF